MEFQNVVNIFFKLPISSTNSEDKFCQTTKKDVNIAKPTHGKQSIDDPNGDAVVPDRGAFGK